MIDYKQFLSTYKLEKNKDTIPEIIFRTGKWKIEDLPDDVLKVFNYTMSINPGYQFVYFDDYDCFNFIESFYPEYVKYYKAIIPTAYRADLFRYLLLKKYGGCYGDVTQKLYVPYDELCKGVERVFCRDTITNPDGLYNALMCTGPSDKVIDEVLEICKKNIDEKNYTDCTLGITGPGALGLAFRNVFGLSKIDLKINNKSLILDFRRLSYIFDNKLSKYDMIFEDSIDSPIGEPKLHNHYSLLYNSDNFGIHNPVSTHYHDMWHKRSVFVHYEELEKELKKTADMKDKKDLNVTGIYNTKGKRLSGPIKGINVIVWSDGSVNRVTFDL